MAQGSRAQLAVLVRASRPREVAAASWGLAYFRAWRTWDLPDGHLSSSLASHSLRPHSNPKGGVRNSAPSWAPTSWEGRSREDGQGAPCRAHRRRGAGATGSP